jgi:hypothetical protein
LLVVNGVLTADMPHEAANMLGKALLKKSAEASQFAAREQVIDDQALLLRRGIPLGLTKRFLPQAMKEAHWNTRLRRLIPVVTGIPSEEAVGVPSLIQHEGE